MFNLCFVNSLICCTFGAPGRFLMLPTNPDSIHEAAASMILYPREPFGNEFEKLTSSTIRPGLPQVIGRDWQLDNLLLFDPECVR
jgi:hypothetical protein